MYTCLSHLFLYNDICCSMYVINIMVVMTMMFMGLRPRMIGLLLSYEMWNITSVNRLNVDNLGPPDVGETAKILVKICLIPDMGMLHLSWLNVTQAKFQGKTQSWPNDLPIKPKHKIEGLSWEIYGWTVSLPLSSIRFVLESLLWIMVVS